MPFSQIVFCYFFAQMSAPGMDDDIEVSVFISIDLDEMVTAA